MKDLLLEKNSNKIVVEDHRWRFTKTRLEYLSQKIRLTISIFEGEWFMDRRLGIPYIPDENTEKNMHRRMIETALQVRIRGIEGVRRFLSFTSTLDKSTRKLRVNFTVQIDTGETYSHSTEVGG
jgi:hypothetical protein